MSALDAAGEDAAGRGGGVERVNVTVQMRLPAGTRVRLVEVVGNEVGVTRASMVLDRECTSVMFARAEELFVVSAENVIVAIDAPGEWRDDA